MADCLRVSLFPKRNRRWRWTGLWADWLTDWLGLVAAEDNAIGSFSVDDLWDRPNDEEVEGNGSDFLGLGLLICVSKVHWTRPKVSEPAMVPSLNRCLSHLAWDRSAWTPIDAMSMFFLAKSTECLICAGCHRSDPAFELVHFNPLGIKNTAVRHFCTTLGVVRTDYPSLTKDHQHKLVRNLRFSRPRASVGNNLNDCVNDLPLFKLSVNYRQRYLPWITEFRKVDYRQSPQLVTAIDLYRIYELFGLLESCR